MTENGKNLIVKKSIEENLELIRTYTQVRMAMQ